MAVFRIQVNYRRGLTGKWSNVWHVNAADLGTAETAFRDEMAPDLLPALNNGATLVSGLISAEGSSAFRTVPINAVGSSTFTGDSMPLFNSMKVFFSDGSDGRPDYKYIKGLLTEALAQTEGVIGDADAAAFETLFDGLISDMDAAGAPLVSIDNDPYLSSSVQRAIQMRQMHRKRKKTVTP
jgi:hypothetical protein